MMTDGKILLAVAASLVCLILFIFSAIVNFATFIVVDDMASAILTGIFGIGVNASWIVYFCRSKYCKEG